MAKKRAPVYDPSKKPKDYLPAHNHILHTPKFTNGMNGFRCFWIPPNGSARVGPNAPADGRTVSGQRSGKCTTPGPTV
jgi:hypothetical protein